MSIWKQTMLIMGEQTCEIEITETLGEGRISRKVKIQNGKVIEKPVDVNILGEYTPDGFIISGIEIIRKRKIRNINAVKDEKTSEDEKMSKDEK